MKIFLILFLFVCVNELNAQQKWNFKFQDILLELHVDSPSNGHSNFTICRSRDSCYSSQELLWPFQHDVFKSEFLTQIKKFNFPSESNEGHVQSISEKALTWIGSLFKKQDAKNEEPSNQLNSLIKEVAVRIPNESVKIGILTLNRNEIEIDGKKYRIKELRATIENGVIGKRSLFVLLSDSSLFFNKKSPINFPQFFKRKTEYLFPWEQNSTRKLQLKDVLEYRPFGKIYYPANAEIILKPEEGLDSDTLEVSASLNNLIEVNVFTDLLGIFGDKANGLIQTEIAGLFISNTAALPKSDITLHSFMKPFLRLSRFDSRFRSMDSSRIKVGINGDTIDRTYMNQIAYLQAGLKANLIQMGFGINQFCQLNIGAEINLVNADSLYKKDIAFFSYLTEFNYCISRLRNFGMEASLKWMWQRVSSAGSEDFRILNRGTQIIFNPVINIFYFPSNDPGTKIYFRFSYFDNLGDSKSNFSQFQVGYKTSLKL
jgi:hypothetical protein